MCYKHPMSWKWFQVARRLIFWQRSLLAGTCGECDLVTEREIPGGWISDLAFLKVETHHKDSIKYGDFLMKYGVFQWIDNVPTVWPWVFTTSMLVFTPYSNSASVSTWFIFLGSVRARKGAQFYAPKLRGNPTEKKFELPCTPTE